LSIAILNTPSLSLQLLCFWGIINGAARIVWDGTSMFDFIPVQ
jgi:hypothetical protein